MPKSITRETLGFVLAGIAIALRMASDWMFASGGSLLYQIAQALLLLLALIAIWSRREIVFLKGGNTRRAILEALLALPIGLILGLALAMMRYRGLQLPTLEQATVMIANNLFFPAIEELEFRGFFLGWLIQRKMAPVLAVWIVAIIHLLAHIHYFWQGNWMTIVTVFLSLLWFGWLTVRTKSLWGAYVAHALFNISAFFPVIGAVNIR